jgi:hypothetical protein
VDSKPASRGASAVGQSSQVPVVPKPGSTLQRVRGRAKVKRHLSRHIAPSWSVSELFSGKRGLSLSLGKRGLRPMSFKLYNPDGSKNPKADLSVNKNADHIIGLIKKGQLKYIHLGTPSSCFSVLRRFFNGALRRVKGFGALPNFIRKKSETDAKYYQVL